MVSVEPNLSVDLGFGVEKKKKLEGGDLIFHLDETLTLTLKGKGWRRGGTYLGFLASVDTAASPGRREGATGGRGLVAACTLPGLGAGHRSKTTRRRRAHPRVNACASEGTYGCAADLIPPAALRVAVVAALLRAERGRGKGMRLGFGGRAPSRHFDQPRRMLSRRFEMDSCERTGPDSAQAGK